MKMGMSIASAPSTAQSPPAAMDADSIAFMAMQAAPSGTPVTPDVARENLRRMRLVNQPDLPQVAQIREYAADGPAGPIPLRAYRGAGTAASDVLPVQIYYHGGGWVIGDLDSHDWTCRMVANAAACAVVSVDYRLAPEHRFPAAFDDALAAAEWIVRNAVRLRVDPARVSVGGDSAGGNLAAAVALALRDRGAIKLRAQILTYPIVDLAAAYEGRFAAGVALTNGGMRANIEHYVPDATQRRDWRASPLHAASLKGLPPALVILAGFDPLYAEGEAYAARLKQDGVAVTMKRYPGQMHGFLSRAKLLPKAYEAVADIAAVLNAHH
jgi:acetyl esterase